MAINFLSITVEIPDKELPLKHSDGY